MDERGVRGSGNSDHFSVKTDSPNKYNFNAIALIEK